MVPKTQPKSSSVWSDVPRRLTTICIGVPLIWKLLARPWTAYIFFAGAHALSAWEYTVLEPMESSARTTATLGTKNGTTRNERLFFCITSLFLAAISETSLWNLGIAFSGCTFCLMNHYHWMVGLLVLTLPFRIWCDVAYNEPSSFASTVSVLLTVWNADTGALVVGRWLGRKKDPNGLRKNPLPEWIQKISPSKTAEGFLGGILGGTMTAIWLVPMLVRWFELDTTPGFVILWGLGEDDSSNDVRSIIRRLVLGFLLSVLAILGDLVESSIKRRSQSKDSGSVLPGHGGILDRFDSSLLAIVLYRAALERANSLSGME